MGEEEGCCAHRQIFSMPVGLRAVRRVRAASRSRSSGCARLPTAISPPVQGVSFLNCKLFKDRAILPGMKTIRLIISGLLLTASMFLATAATPLQVGQKDGLRQFQGIYRVGAICNDGTQSSATGSGACSHHGGVNCWLYSDGSCR
jgi:hypothetical protein